jgi:hypothetical protein
LALVVRAGCICSVTLCVGDDAIVRKRRVDLYADVLAIYHVEFLSVYFIKVVAEITGDLVIAAYSIVDLSVF